jgi:hypothetical protein
MQFSLGELNQTWQKYGLTEAPLLFNGQKTPFKAIIREGKLVTIAGRSYYLLPNEYVKEIADKAAELAGLKPFKGGATRNKKLIQEGNVFYNREKTVMHAWYAPDATIDVEGEKMHIGCNVINSIDGSTAFGCSVFTFRHICSNGVIIGYRQIAAFRHIHVQSLSKVIENLKNQMLLIMDEANAIIEKYRQLAQQMADEELINRIKKSRIPKKVLPEYLQTPEEEAEGYIPAVTKWQLYNDITEAIWHNSSSDLRTKQFQFQTLHAIMKV